MKILKFADFRKGMDSSGTMTIFLDEDTVLKISPADFMAATSKIVDDICMKNKIPPRVIDFVKDSIEDIKKVEKPKKVMKPLKIKKTSNKKPQRLAKTKKRDLLAFISKFVDNTRGPVEFVDMETDVIVGTVPRERVVNFLQQNGYIASYEPERKTLVVEFNKKN